MAAVSPVPLRIGACERDQNKTKEDQEGRIDL